MPSYCLPFLLYYQHTTSESGDVPSANALHPSVRPVRVDTGWTTVWTRVRLRTQIYVYFVSCHHHCQHEHHKFDFDFATETKKKGILLEIGGLAKVRLEDDAIEEEDRESDHHNNRILLLSHPFGGTNVEEKEE